jgi:hypothetical protein
LSSQLVGELLGLVDVPGKLKCLLIGPPGIVVAAGLMERLGKEKVIDVGRLDGNQPGEVANRLIPVAARLRDQARCGKVLGGMRFSSDVI